jgi:hypothetical protein
VNALDAAGLESLGLALREHGLVLQDGFQSSSTTIDQARKEGAATLTSHMGGRVLGCRVGAQYDEDGVNCEGRLSRCRTSYAYSSPKELERRMPTQWFSERISGVEAPRRFPVIVARDH